MAINDAMQLYLNIERDYKHLKPEVHRIGNGEHVVILSSVDYYLWSWQDWRKYKRTSS